MTKVIQLYILVFFITWAIPPVLPCTAFGKGEPSLDSTIVISLEKHSFKAYEPVLVLAKYTNYSGENDSLYHLWTNSADELKFFIKSEKGIEYSGRKTYLCILFIPSVKYILKPGESLTMSTYLNDYGEWIYYVEGQESRFYFDLTGYIPVGKYTAYAEQMGGSIYNRGKFIRRTNEISFEVTELNDEDRNILKMERDKKYSEIISSYPENPFTEHVMANYLSRQFLYENKLPYPFRNTEIINAYKKFFEKHPKSLYNYNCNGEFIVSMFLKLANNTDDINEYMNLLVSGNNSDSYVYDYLNQDAARSYIYKSIDSYRERLFHQKR